jgi:hypothetical protein
MTARSPSSGAIDDRSGVEYQGFALVDLPPGGRARVDVELVGGRDRWSVGGQIAEGPRWWRGRLAGGDNGRTAPAVVERTAEPGILIRGLGPPPFEVP